MTSSRWRHKVTHSF